MRACPISFLRHLRSGKASPSASANGKAGPPSQLSLSGPLLPPGRPVLVTGAVKGAAVIGGTEEPLHLILIQILISTVNQKLRIVAICELIVLCINTQNSSLRAPLLVGLISIQ